MKNYTSASRSPWIVFLLVFVLSVPFLLVGPIVIGGTGRALRHLVFAAESAFISALAASATSQARTAPLFGG